MVAVHRVQFVTAEQVLAERHLTKNDRVKAAREALKARFGHHVNVHAGSSNSWDSPGEDTTHWLYITIYLKKEDKLNKRSGEQARAEVIKVLQRSNVPLYHTSFCLANKDEYAISLDVYRFKPGKDRGWEDRLI